MLEVLEVVLSGLLSLRHRLIDLLYQIRPVVIVAKIRHKLDQVNDQLLISRVVELND